MRPRAIRDSFIARSLRASLLALAVFAPLGGCTAISRDVQKYYQQMAVNFKDAEEKAKVDIMTLEHKSVSYLQRNDSYHYNQARKEITKLKDWQAHCARQRERFEQAAHKINPADTETPASESIAEGPSHPTL